MARKSKDSLNNKSLSSSTTDDDWHSLPCEDQEMEEEMMEETGEEMEETGEEMEETEEEMEETGEEMVDTAEEKNEIPLPWSKNDDLELFNRIRQACPKDDTMKYKSRVNQLNWESIKFQDYSAEQCKNRWLHVQTHLRNYRILGEVLEDAALWVDRPWYHFNNGAKNNRNHPEQPKKPLTAYVLFYMEQRDAVLKKQPGLGFAELNKIIAKMYEALSDRKKTRYCDMAEKEKKIYQEKMKKFMDNHPDYICQKSKNAKAGHPKLPTPFKLFRDEKMAQLLAEGITSTEAREQCRDAYKKLKDKQKLKWIYQALEQEHDYYEELDKFKTKHPNVEFPAKKSSLLTKDEIQIKNKYEGKPDRPPNSGYSLFSKKLLSGNSLKHFETTERMSEIARLWKELTDKERTSYNDKARQMFRSYKMKYASYLETLTPEQKNTELENSARKSMKRTADKKALKQLVAKKQKMCSPVGSSSEMVSNEDESSDEDDFDGLQETTIQKPISSLQMFCHSNMDKYSSKHPKLTKQELTKLMAKEFAKLSEEKKKIYGNMGRKSKKMCSSNNMASVSLTPKANTSKTTESSKLVNGKSATPATALKSPELGPSPKKSAAHTDSKSVKSPKKLKPTLNANNVKDASSKTTESPIWASNPPLFKIGDMKEPPKPPETAAAYYALTHRSKTGNLTPTEIDVLWGKVSEKQKKKYIEELNKMQKNYRVEFENFLRSMNVDELITFRAFMNNRSQVQEEDGDNQSSDEEFSQSSSNEDQRSVAFSDDEPEISSDED